MREEFGYTFAQILENKRKAINERNKIINALWLELHSLFSDYDKPILKADGSFRKDIQEKIYKIVDKHRNGNVRLYVDCTNYGRIILKTDRWYSVGTCVSYAAKDIRIAMIDNNKISKMEDVELLEVFNKDSVLSVVNELEELKREVEQATEKMKKVKYGSYNEFLE